MVTLSLFKSHCSRDSRYAARGMWKVNLSTLGKWLWWKGGSYPRGSALTKHLTLKEFSEIFHNIESVKDKMLEMDPKLERSMTTHHNTTKILTPHHKLHDEKKATTLQTTLDKDFLQRSNMLQFLMFPVF